MNNQVSGADITGSWLPRLPGVASQKQCGQVQLCTCLGKHAGTCLLSPGLYKLYLCPLTTALHPPVTNKQLPEQHPISIDIHSFAHKALCQKFCRQAEGALISAEEFFDEERLTGRHT